MRVLLIAGGEGLDVGWKEGWVVERERGEKAAGSRRQQRAQGGRERREEEEKRRGEEEEEEQILRDR